MYTFNILVVLLNQDQNAKDLVINFQEVRYLIIPAIGCSLQTSVLFCNFILYKYNNYNIWEKTKNYPNDDCSICLEHLSTKIVVKLKCSHHYHQDCISESLKISNKCPICRTDLALELC